MANKVHAFVVILENDMHPDEAEFLKRAIATMRNVLEVKPQNDAIAVMTATVRVKSELREKLFETLKL